MGEIYLRVLFSRAGLPAASFNMLSIRMDSVFSPQKADMLIKVCSNSVPPGGGGGGGSAQKLPFGKALPGALRWCGSVPCAH